VEGAWWSGAARRRTGGKYVGGRGTDEMGERRRSEDTGRREGLKAGGTKTGNGEGDSRRCSCVRRECNATARGRERGEASAAGQSETRRNAVALGTERERSHGWESEKEKRGGRREKKGWSRRGVEGGRRL